MRRLAVIVVLCGSLPAFGWWPEGHNRVARLAAAHLTPAAAARVAEILGQGTTIQSIASWPDQVRPTGNRLDGSSRTQDLRHARRGRRRQMRRRQAGYQVVAFRSPAKCGQTAT